MPTPRPFKLKISEPALADLRERLARTRFADEPPAEPWATGTSLTYLKELVAYWENGFSWKAWEDRLNTFEQFKVDVAGIDLHYIHAQSQTPGAPPLLLVHGWPGSVFEFHKILPLLTRHFTVVAPSLPGYGLSFAPGQARFGAPQIADAFAQLMTMLGYERFAYQGGDWGASVGSVLGWRHPQRLSGLHLNLLMVPRDPNQETSTPQERQYLGELREFLKEETGYQWIQGTRPQTLAYALTDSPTGLAAWIVEKFRAWTDNDGNPESAVSRDEMLANISLYWFTGAIGSSFWPYYERLHGEWPIPRGKTVDVRLAYAAFPKEIIRPPRSLAEKIYTNIQRWTDMPRGGHFAALEQPERLAADVIEFFS
ncbi:MAG: alpha/beta fold hydrolase [Ramlibacter sp.]